MAIVRRFDRGELSKPRRQANGYLRVDAYLTRSGVFSYRQADGSQLREYRPPDEVFNADSLASFDLAPVTNDHPPVGMLTPENTHQFQVGSAGGLTRDGDRVRGSLVLTDAKAIAALEGGRRQISLGYSADLEMTPGITPEGERYDAIQRRITGNHVAIVDVARAGPEIRVRMDSADGAMVDSGDPVVLASPESDTGKTPERTMALRKIKLDGGAEIEVDEAVAAHVDAIRAKADKEAAEAKASTDKLQARTDAAEAKVAELTKSLAEAPAKALASAKARAELEAKAREVLGAEAKMDSMDDAGVKRAVVAKLSGDQLEGKSAEYVAARFDAEIALLARSNPALAAARAATTVRADSAQDPLTEAVLKYEAALKGKA